MKKIIDTQGADTSLSLPKAGTVPIGEPLVNVVFMALQEELSQFYGDRYQVVDIEPEEPAPARSKSSKSK